ncbi:MAG: dUTP diphosphatase [bacterium]|nr:dUTP diphosphatase [bacterium]
MKIQLKKLTNTAKLPMRGSEQAAGYDVYADISEPLIIAPGETVKVPTGLAVAIPDGYFGGLYARSGLATKQGIRPANCVGIVDSDYRGELIFALHNDSNREQTIGVGERVGQLVVQPFLSVTFDEVEELSDTARGEGGFGSTGTN